MNGPRNPYNDSVCPLGEANWREQDEIEKEKAWHEKWDEIIKSEEGN